MGLLFNIDLKLPNLAWIYGLKGVMTTMRFFKNLSLVSVRIGKFPYLNIGFVKSSDITAEEINIIITNLENFLKN